MSVDYNLKIIEDNEKTLKLSREKKSIFKVSRNF